MTTWRVAPVDAAGAEVFVLCCWGAEYGGAEPYVTVWPTEERARAYHDSLETSSDPGAQWFIERHFVDRVEYEHVDGGLEVSQ